jgi:IclR family transcriptional regulator, KDG regulon repressor
MPGFCHPKHGTALRNEQAMLKPNNLVQTIERISAILDLVGQNPKGVSIREVSAQLDLPKGTVHRLLSSLIYVGYIRQDAVSRSYFLGLKLLDLGGLVASQLDLRKIAAPLLRALADETRETVHMVVWDQGEVVYIEKVEPLTDMGGLRMASRIGSRNPAHSCAVGKIFLSYLSPDDLEDFISAKGLPARTSNTITDGVALKQELKTIREQGYALDNEENEKGIRCIGAATLDESGTPVAAISVSGPAFRVTKKIAQEILRRRVVETAAEISQRLGYGGTENRKSANETK